MKANADCGHQHNGGYFWEDCCGKVGVAGSMLACIFCLGLPGIVSLVTTIGLGFMVKHTISVAMLIGCIVLTLGGLILGMLHHKKPWAVILGLINAALVIAFTLVWHDPVYAFVGIGGLMASSVLSIWYEQHKSYAKRVSPELAQKITNLHHTTNAAVAARVQEPEVEAREG